MRLDKWLWHARFFKSRSLAARFVETARCRLDGRVVEKAHTTVAPGMVLTFALGPRVRVVRIRALGERRGPSPEARTLYDEIDDA
jgi:ribosome-associated heat shock protein Hsp15